MSGVERMASRQSVIEPVIVEIDDGILTVTINRPEVRNAVNMRVAQAIASAMDELDGRGDVAVGILTGAGGTFCAGMDLAAFANGERPSLPGRGFAGVTERPPAKPLIAAVEGWALAGGCELTLAADLTVAARDAKFGIPEVKRGLVAAAGGLLRLGKVIPYRLAMEAALTGDHISAEDARQYGLVNVLADPGQALVEARVLAARIRDNGPLAIQASKKILVASVQYNDAQMFQLTRAEAEAVMTSADAQEGSRAFLEKRRPVWKGH